MVHITHLIWIHFYICIGLLVVLGKEIKIKGTTKKNSKELKSFVKYILKKKPLRDK